MDTILDQIKDFIKTSDEDTKIELSLKLRALADSLETPDNTLDRIAFGGLTTAVVRTCSDLKLFHLLSESNEPLSIDGMSKATGASPMLLGRLMRHLSAVGVLNQTGVERFQNNQVSRNLCVPAVEAGIHWFFTGLAPQFLELPSYLQKTGYQNPSDDLHSVLQQTYKLGEGENGFDWLRKNPEILAVFQKFMSIRRQGAQETWLSVYPVEEETRSWDPEKAVFVNIGGNVGMQNAEFRKRYPNVPGRVVLQDRQENIEKAIHTPGVENLTYDFFTPQQIKGAKYYYFRTVLHNWPDEKVVEILRTQREAMEDESRILVDEMVVPDMGAKSWSTSIDLVMLCGHASCQRTQSQWDHIFTLAGLKRLSTAVYQVQTGECVMTLQAA